MYVHPFVWGLFLNLALFPLAEVNGGPVALADVQSRLLTKLLSNYDNRVPPQFNYSQPVHVGINLLLINLVDLHEHEEVMETFVYLEQFWQDFRFRWEPSDYQRISSVLIPDEQIWQPDFSLFNGIEVGMEKKHTFGLILKDGSVYYNTKIRMRTQCEMDMKRFPFDTQTCTIKLGSYMYDSTTLNLTHGHEKLGYVDTYASNREWQITDMSTEIRTKTYPCCPGGFQHARFTFQVKRNTVYYTYVFILPAVILAMLVPLQFLLPHDCRERLTIGSTVLLGSLVIIFMIQTFLPDAHPTLPYIVQYYCLTLVWAALSMLCSMWVINTQAKRNRKRRVPGIIKQVFLKGLKKLVCVSDDAYYPLEESETVSLRSLEKQVLANSEPVKNEINKLERDIEDILRQVNVLVQVVSATHVDTQTEWYQVALVFDRVMCFLFSLVFVVYTCVLLG